MNSLPLIPSQQKRQMYIPRFKTGSMKRNKKEKKEFFNKIKYIRLQRTRKPSRIADNMQGEVQ
jgi:hypothetical protein